MREVEGSLGQAGIGTGNDENRYALVGFDGNRYPIRIIRDKDSSGNILNKAR